MPCVSLTHIRAYKTILKTQKLQKINQKTLKSTKLSAKSAKQNNTILNTKRENSAKPATSLHKSPAVVKKGNQKPVSDPGAPIRRMQFGLALPTRKEKRLAAKERRLAVEKQRLLKKELAKKLQLEKIAKREQEQARKAELETAKKAKKLEKAKLYSVRKAQKAPLSGENHNLVSENIAASDRTTSLKLGYSDEPVLLRDGDVIRIRPIRVARRFVYLPVETHTNQPAVTQPQQANQLAVAKFQQTNQPTTANPYQVEQALEVQSQPISNGFMAQNIVTNQEVSKTLGQNVASLNQITENFSAEQPAQIKTVKPKKEHKFLKFFSKPRQITRPNNASKNALLVPTLSARPSRDELINAESRLGSQIFGPIPAGHRREFFHYRRGIWIWHEDWTDAGHTEHDLTVRYEVRPSGIYKKIAAGKYFKLEGNELENFRQATRAYLSMVKSYLYQGVGDQATSN